MLRHFRMIYLRYHCSMDKHSQIILLGGAPTTGKSTITKALSAQLGLPWISTDHIRELMRVTARREDYPDLFELEGYSAERYLTEFSAKEIADMEWRQSIATWIGIRSFIENNYTWRDGFIMEWVNILPDLVARDLGDRQGIRTVFLVDSDTDRTRDVVFTRGLWGAASSYSDDVKKRRLLGYTRLAV